MVGVGGAPIESALGGALNLGIGAGVGMGLGGGGGGPTEQDNCGLVPYVLDQLPAPALLVQDRSTSMRGSTKSGGTRWQNVSTAVQSVVAQTETRISWGLKLFPNETPCQVALGPELAPRLSNAAPIVSALTAIVGDSKGAGLTDGTPTRKALQDATSFLSSLNGKNKYIVLATDGQPTCLDDDTDSEDETAALDAGRAAVAAGLKIAVIGISFGAVDPGDELDPKQKFLNDMADIGGMTRNDPRDPATRYYPAESTAELVQAFSTITSQVVSCTFPLPKVPPVPDNVAVKINGSSVTHDAVNGWDYDTEMRSVSLNGEACRNLTSGGVTSDVKIIMGCPGQIVR